MFNLFGSFFFGRGSTVEPTNNNETSSTSPSSELTTLIQNPEAINTSTSNTDAATQTAVDDQLLMVTSQTHTSNGDMDELQKQWVIVERAKQQQQQQQQQQMQHQCVATSTTHLDDVKEEDETPVLQHTEVEMSEEATLPTRDDEDDGDVLVGSFFDRNQFDESSKEESENTTSTASNPAPTRDEWLITPLPCLTSITCSQRSLVENDPLENLLIEHPSMSVFVTVTSSAMATPITTTTEPIESAVFKVFSENVKEEKKVETSLGKSVVVVVSQRKRKGMESAQSPSSQQHQSPSPTSTMRRKANKRNKKSSPSVSVSLSPVAATSAAVSTETVQSGPVVNSNNKENMQVRTLLTSEFRSKANPASKLDSILLSKNQLKRNNKHANKFNSNNCIQRKFHKLQQPVCC